MPPLPPCDHDECPATECVQDESPYTLDVTVADGKYTVRQEASGRLVALRYGEPWRDCVGDGLIFALAVEVEELRNEIKRRSS